MSTKSEAIFGLQCFWGSEAKFGAINGVMGTSVGYTGGSTPNPTYKNLSDHTEVVRIVFDKQIISFKELLDIFWTTQEPTHRFKRQYMSAIFVRDSQQKQLAEQTLKERQKQLSQPIVTEILKFDVFYLAEDYHQKYFLRKHSSLLAELNLTNSEIVDSLVSARINAFCAGFGTKQQFEELIKTSGIRLSEDNQKVVTKAIEGGPNLGEC